MNFTDQTGNVISLENTPRRIISLVPSQTELLYDLGLNEEVIGITKFCIHPEEWFRSKTKVGGTKQLNIARIKQLNPDLIIANKEENVKEQIGELQQHFPVWISDVNTIVSAYDMMLEVGKMINKADQALSIINAIKDEFRSLQLQTKNDKQKTIYLIWRDPYMAAGGDTFISSMMKACGLINLLENKERYPEIRIEDIIADQNLLILLSSEPYPFKDKHSEEIRSLGYNGNILLADGEMFSWYGSRMLKAPAYFRRLLATIYDDFV